ncbi:bZIP transcription factor [Rudanella paleaurantiibacter]|nr:bZIP transcription factor [Rudanella paleaurantiibacter]
MGRSAGVANSGGSLNVFIGFQSASSNTTGSFNTMLGNAAGAANTVGEYNTFVGHTAGQDNQTGANNVAIGRAAGTNNLSGGFNTYVGFASGASAGQNNLTNASAFGANAQVSVSNAVVLGNNANVGIGTSAPSAKLHVVSSTTNTSGLRLQNLTSSSPATALAQTKFLTVDASGNVVLGSLNNSAREASASVGESYWQLAGGRLQNSSGEAVVIGQGINKLSGNYGLYVEKGILTEKVKVAVKNSADWSDYVFAPAYRLRKLSEVESFIKAHGHLPDVPSAAEVVREGVDMAKMDATLLQKIEELTLYMIELKKENEFLKRKLHLIEEKVYKQDDK